MAPIPGKGAVGVEIPNPKAEMVFLREILESRQFGRTKAELPLALGRDLTGRPYVADLARMPHALIAGATGSGKSVCLNAFITSLVYRHTPETLRFLLIDPKMVELSAYVDLPHLRHPVVTDPRDAAGVLKWAVFEMERRYELLHANTVRSIGEFNKKLREGVPLRRVHPKGPDGDPDRWLWKDGPMPYVVLVVDELADLMMTVQSEVEKPLTLLAQKARAIGIHLLVATQRPSSTSSPASSRPTSPLAWPSGWLRRWTPERSSIRTGPTLSLETGICSSFPPGLPNRSGSRVPTSARRKPNASPPGTGIKHPSGPTGLGKRRGGRRRRTSWKWFGAWRPKPGWRRAVSAGDEERDDRFWDAAEVCIQQNQGSTSLLQRRLKIGYGRAARVVDQLHDAGILGPPDGSKAREVLMTLSDLEFLRRGEEEELVREAI